MKDCTDTKPIVESIDLEEALKLLKAAENENIRHVISVVRDPRDPSRILSINMAEPSST